MMVGGKVAYVTKNGLGPKSKYGYSGKDKVGIDKVGARSVNQKDKSQIQVIALT